MSELSQLSPQPLWDIFAKICSIPHPSYHEEQLAEYIVGWAKEKGFHVERDQVGNILIRKPATAGMENRKPPIQGLTHHILGQAAAIRVSLVIRQHAVAVGPREESALRVKIRDEHVLQPEIAGQRVQQDNIEKLIGRNLMLRQLGEKAKASVLCTVHGSFILFFSGPVVGAADRPVPAADPLFPFLRPILFHNYIVL